MKKKIHSTGLLLLFLLLLLMVVVVVEVVLRFPMALLLLALSETWSGGEAAVAPHR